MDNFLSLTFDVILKVAGVDKEAEEEKKVDEMVDNI